MSDSEKQWMAIADQRKAEVNRLRDQNMALEETVYNLTLTLEKAVLDLEECRENDPEEGAPRGD